MFKKTGEMKRAPPLPPPPPGHEGDSMRLKFGANASNSSVIEQSLQCPNPREYQPSVTDMRSDPSRAITNLTDLAYLHSYPLNE